MFFYNLGFDEKLAKITNSENAWNGGGGLGAGGWVQRGERARERVAPEERA
jgi:hypothetical protein